ncbi:hypothetical protein DFJ77DRAFT_442911 [Powellomyces hirtus]|nr:hypothetical protein DFJ77DRAFT_442911 [Powellomyces hirtus]
MAHYAQSFSAYLQKEHAAVTKIYSWPATPDKDPPCKGKVAQFTQAHQQTLRPGQTFTVHWRPGMLRFSFGTEMSFDWYPTTHSTVQTIYNTDYDKYINSNRAYGVGKRYHIALAMRCSRICPWYFCCVTLDNVYALNINMPAATTFPAKCGIAVSEDPQGWRADFEQYRTTGLLAGNANRFQKPIIRELRGAGRKEKEAPPFPGCGKYTATEVCHAAGFAPWADARTIYQDPVLTERLISAYQKHANAPRTMLRSFCGSICSDSGEYNKMIGRIRVYRKKSVFPAPAFYAQLQERNKRIKDRSYGTNAELPGEWTMFMNPESQSSLHCGDKKVEVFVYKLGSDLVFTVFRHPFLEQDLPTEIPLRALLGPDRIKASRRYGVGIFDFAGAAQSVPNTKPGRPCKATHVAGSPKKKSKHIVAQ